MSSLITPSTLDRMVHDHEEVAVVDVREHGEYGAEHLLFCTSIPFSRLELKLEHLLPNRHVRLVIYDQCDGTNARRAAEIAEALGYRQVMRLQGGIEAWKAAGHSTFGGVHVPSKTFGELVEHSFGTPSLSAAELAQHQQSGEPIVVVDGRPWEEYQAMNIPGSLSCPNGELVYRLGELVQDGDTPIVVNCAGRTRSIIGCEMLRQFGVSNPVYALENGTMGWRLAGLELEHSSRRRAGVDTPGPRLEAMRERALEMARQAGASHLSSAQARTWLDDPSRTTYLLDVRDPREYQHAHLEGAISAPGGQLIQATETYVGVRRSRLILVDDTEVRAALCAFWLAQMDYEVAFLAGGRESWWAAARAGDVPARALASRVQRMSVDALAAELADDQPPLLLDCRASMAYRRGHAAGAVWTNRSRLDETLAGRHGESGVRVIGNDDGVDELLVLELAHRGFGNLAMIDGGFAAWQAADQPTEATPCRPSDAECVDYLFFAHDRHAGNLEAARQYLAWEQGLVEALTPQERKHFTLKPANASQTV